MTCPFCQGDALNLTEFNGGPICLDCGRVWAIDEYGDIQFRKVEMIDLLLWEGLHPSPAEVVDSRPDVATGEDQREDSGAGVDDGEIPLE